MSTRVISTKLTEEEHGKLVEVCNEKGCTPSKLIKDAVLEKIGLADTEDRDLDASELRKLLGIRKQTYD